MSTVYISFWDGTDKWAVRFMSPLTGKTSTTENDDFEFYPNVGS